MEVGRPKKYDSPEKMQEDIDKYFKECRENDRPYTMTGLAIALDMDRKTLLNYRKEEGYEPFFHTVKSARDKVERFLEEKLLTDNAVTGVIFNLKNNFDWKDKQEIDANVSNTKIEVKLTDE